jgi:hypothetical protein
MINRHRRHLAAYRREGDSYLIEIKLRDLRQLFNTLDPAPFHEKDLDPVAEEYLVSAVREVGANSTKLVFYVPEDSDGNEVAALAPAIRHYFIYRARHTGEQLRLLLKRGLISFVIGCVFLFACLSLRQLIGTLSGSASNAILSEGLLILGWVAMWRPVEIFLYDWWPELGKRRVFARIGGMSIEARPGTSVGNSELSEPLTDLPTAQRLPQTA